MIYLAPISLMLIVIWLIVATYQESQEEHKRLDSLDGEWAEPKWR